MIAIMLFLMLAVVMPRSAGAECAWVLWTKLMSDNPAAPPEGSWILREAYPDRLACEASEDLRRQASPEERIVGTSRYVRTQNCFPDTIDPRGPKGSGR